MAPPHEGHRHHESDQSAHHEHDVTGLLELLDLDGIVLRSYLSDVTNWVAQWAPEPVRSIVDLGTGTGMGSFALARRFEQAAISAVDGSAQSLTHLSTSATGLGLGERVTAHHLDLDEAFPPVTSVDLFWSSLAMHHFADPVSVARQVRESLSDNGIFVVVEMIDSPSFLPEVLGFGTPGLESRCHAALAAERAEALPYLGADWRKLLEEAGLVIVAEREFTIDPERPYSTEAHHYARGYLKRLRDGIGERLSADDLAALDTLFDDTSPHSILLRTDLDIRGTRQAWVARRP